MSALHGRPLLDGSVALVTGAGRGLGAAISQVMAEHGASVVVAARSEKAGERTVAKITAAGGAAVFVPCDVTVRAEVDAAVAAAVDTFGALDIVVHNANSNRSGAAARVEDVQVEDWDDVVRVALLGAFNCAQAAHKALRRREGRFIVLTSAAGIEGNEALPAYATAKAAQRGFVKSLAHEWGPAGITVNALAPVAETEALASYVRGDPEVRRRLTARAALGRLGDPERDVAGAAVFLASGLARFVTGQTLVVDGGACMAL